MKVDREIDVVGKACPIPLIALAKEVRTMLPGQTVSIRGNDPIFQQSVEELCRSRGIAIREATREGKVVTMILQL
jgi:TusA-related sulfurtransferase